MAYTLAADKKVELQISYVDANGNPAVVDGAVTWESSNPDIATIEPSATPPGPGVAAVVWLTPGTDVGNVQVAARADADLGSGVREIVTPLDVTVVGGEAVAGTITPVGEPVPV
jgi:hypothetical protein